MSRFKGQGVGNLIGMLFFLIVLIAAVIPVTTTVINNQAFTGVNLTIANLFPLFLLLGGLSVVIAVILGRQVL